ncbi:ly6/PLAUR domain-containing protein 5 [Meriones unguiculatus]|uniref:ly6/PLAUR domain-containing protein 5 n=1 Tax=Meriones unguiculatus TaxID=10047 RepID=UPI000B4F9B79|nr:ly6/PLAUR domain-containing protein 5 [Meriones unguiculatus]XP_060222352.1 ly6/PLAUR domain-containing protein 5 [Meriones unguiculatus]
MALPRTLLLCLLGSGLCLTGSHALQCYSFEHTYFGPFDLSAMKFPSVSCPQGCSEVILSLDTGYRALVTMVRKGCWTGPTTGPMQSNQEALPPDYAVVRGCATDFCNADLKTHDAVPNLSQAPDPPTLSGTECYACLGVHPEDCAPERSRRVQCHQDQSACFQGNGKMTIGNFSVPVYIRTCHRPSCTTMGTTSPWTSIDLQGHCCQGHLCNRDSVTQSLPGITSAAPPQARRALPLAALGLAVALGVSLGLPA